MREVRVKRSAVYLVFTTSIVLVALSWVCANEIPVTRWAGPDGSAPVTHDEWISDKDVSRSPSIEVVPGLTSLATNVLIIVNTELYPTISVDLTGFVSDLVDDGYSPSVLTCDDIQGPLACDSLRSILSTYHEDGLQGAVFIGDLPIPWFHMLDDFDGDSVFEGYEEFPCDLYYMDLDGEWMDTLMWDGVTFSPGSDGMFDVHSGEVTPEIWVGRLVPSVVGPEDTLLANYFEKDSIYRNEGLGLARRALAFVDDDWVWWAGEWSANIGMAYPEIVTVADSESTIAANYRSGLSDGYEWISVFAHSWPGGHGFKYGLSEWSYFYSYEVPLIDPEANFYNLFACSNARYIEDGNMGCMVVFSDTYGLGAIGTTKTGSMLNFDEFYYPLGKGATIGEAFRDWFISRGSDGYQSWESSWFYGMALLGDPTLRVSPPHGVAADVEIAEPAEQLRLVLAPNPVVGPTVIRWNARGVKGVAKLRILDCAGRVVRTFPTGSAVGSVTWNGESESGLPLPAGFYLCQLGCGELTTTESFVLLQ
jgi:hypothetical protein